LILSFANHFFVSKHARIWISDTFRGTNGKKYEERSNSMLTSVLPMDDVNINLHWAARQSNSLRRTGRPRFVTQAALLLTATIRGLLLWIRLVAFAFTSSRKISGICFRTSHSRCKPFSARKNNSQHSSRHTRCE